MTYRDIPESAIEVQTGLWWDHRTFTFNGNVYNSGALYSAEGYCFYEIAQPENYDEEGNLKPANELVYAIYMTSGYATSDEINAAIVSVPYQEGYEVVNVPTNPPVTE